jgi:hypothetical protein
MKLYFVSKDIIVGMFLGLNIQENYSLRRCPDILDELLR